MKGTGFGPYAIAFRMSGALAPEVSLLGHLAQEFGLFSYATFSEFSTSGRIRFAGRKYTRVEGDKNLAIGKWLRGRHPANYLEPESGIQGFHR
jgi:hypothetical protein